MIETRKKKMLKNLRVERIDFVDKGASMDLATGEGAHILLYKGRSGETELDPTKTLREHVLEKLEAIGEEMRKKDPKLTKAKSIVKATHEHPELYRLYRDPNSRLPIREAVEKMARRRELEKHGFSSFGEAVAEIAKGLSPDDFSKGLKMVQERWPILWGEYEQERRG